jgi:hypothetical protein
MIPAAGGTGRVAVAATRECTWSASAESTWLAVRSGQSGQGDGMVEFTVARNPDPAVRRGALVVNEQRAEVTQEAGACEITLGTSSASFTPGGGSGRVDVRASSSLCTWTVTASDPWIQIRAGSEGRGNGEVLFDVAETAGPPRSGTLTIAGQQFSVTQSEGCSFSINPMSQSMPASGGHNTVAVTTADGCPWTAASNVPWMTLSPRTGTGAGTVSVSVSAANGPSRTGTAVIADRLFTVTQSDGCAFQVEPTTLSVGAPGGTESVTVRSATGCEWGATSNVPWLTIQVGSSGTGNGTVTFAVEASSGAARSGTLTVAGQSIAVQQAQGCTFAVAPTSATVPNAGGQTAFDVQAGAACAWTAASQVSWITIASGASGSGNGTVQLTVAANTGASRTGTVNVADKTFSVTQGSGCAFSLSSTSQSVSTAGGTGSVAVTAPSGCQWTAASNASWLSITGGATGNGNGTVNFAAAQNTGPGRTGTLTIAGQTFTVNQGTACSFVIAPEQQTVNASGGSATVTVTAGSGCSWTAMSNVTWVTVTSGASGSGGGTVQLTIAANTGAGRTGTVTIAGRTFTVNQGAPCTFTVTPEMLTPTAAGGTAGIDVAAAAGCAWTATTTTPWITISSGATGNGNGRVSLTFAANTGAPRTGSLLVAGRTVTVNQSSGCTFALSAPSTSIPQNGGSGSVNVIAGAGCSWTAVSQVPWIVITSNSSGSGNGTVQFTVQARIGGGPRSGTITIAGLTFTVNQN